MEWNGMEGRKVLFEEAGCKVRSGSVMTSSLSR